jgi:flagellar biosynthesis anti-sigma factor FlgM
LQQPAGGKAEPAAVIGLSEAAKVAQALPMAANADKLDLDLVQEIRQRIADGTFEIDYQTVAGNLLGNAVAAVRAGRG